MLFAFTCCIKPGQNIFIPLFLSIVFILSSVILFRAYKWMQVSEDKRHQFHLTYEDQLKQLNEDIKCSTIPILLSVFPQLKDTVVVEKTLTDIQKIRGTITMGNKKTSLFLDSLVWSYEQIKGDTTSKVGRV